MIGVAKTICIAVLLALLVAILENAFQYFNSGGLRGSFASIVLVCAVHVVGAIALAAGVRFIWRFKW